MGDRIDSSEPPTKPESKYGFKIYRTHYGDETQWESFLDYLNAQTHENMRNQNLGHEIPNLDWAIESSPDLANASEEDIRRYVARACPTYFPSSRLIQRCEVDSSHGPIQAMN